MHAETLLHRWLCDVLPKMHMKRREALGAVISGAFLGGRLTVTSLGRCLRGTAKTKHNIKRADRLLSNLHLQNERDEVYASVLGRFLDGTHQPVILVDWSDIDARRKFFLLRASLPVKGRSLTLYEEVHERRTKEKPATHKSFLKKLRAILPRCCRPVIITDAGFRSPWFRQVRAFGWDFIGRVRNREMVQFDKLHWISAKSLYSQAHGKPQCLGDALLTAHNPFYCRFVLFKARLKGRVHRGKMGRRKRNHTSLVNSARAREPWLIATSLADEAGRIIQLYARPMQIEESFRDLKCPRLGLSLYLNGTYKIERMKLLVMIGSLAATFAWLLGKAAQYAEEHWQFQANSVRHQRVLSAVFIGIQAFRIRHFQISSLCLGMAQQRLQNLICSGSCPS
jgi:hypothetical protein